MPTDEGENAEFLVKRLSIEGTEWKVMEGYVACNLGETWVEKWPDAKKPLTLLGSNVKIALIHSLKPPSADEVSHSCKTLDEVELLAENHWLLEYLESNLIVCHFQSVVDRNKNNFGWESFARIIKDNGETISGYQIIQASRALNIRHVLDRHLQVLAVRDFMAFNLSGVIFINFMPDFIQRPEKYLEGLEEEAKRQNLLTRRIVLEFPLSIKSGGKVAVERVVEFCRSKGFLISLDDVEDFAECEKLITTIKPDFIKLDRKITTGDAYNSNSISKLISFAHNKNCSVLAEGIEDEATYKKLLKLDVDLFQGYHFSRPERPKQ